MIEEEIIPEELEEESEPSVLSRIAKGIIALLVLGGFIYLSGINQALFFKRTSSSVQQQTIESAIDAERITVPLSIFLVRSDEINGSVRTKDDVAVLVEKASQIWEQASVDLEIQDLYEIERTDEEIALLLDSPRTFIARIVEFDPLSINVFLVARLRGINGIAFGGLQSIAVADYTTVYDFRALAHEIGHVLSLGHVENSLQLMHQGANGFELSLEEIFKARENAERF